MPAVQLTDRAGYRARWSALHGGYDAADSRVVNGWLTLMEAAARPLARRGVSPDVVTLIGVGSAAAALPAAFAGGRWWLAAGAAVAGSGLADGLDGAVAALSGRATAWGYVVDSLADRAADALHLLALRRAGACGSLTLVAAAGIVTLEYGRARAGNAGFGEIGVVTVGERPIRIIAATAGLLLAGYAPGRARGAATGAAAIMAAVAAAGAGQFLRVAAGELRRRQAGPMSPATARAESATSGNPPPG
jgi:phosphatidylglycerophosphate synthase